MASVTGVTFLGDSILRRLQTEVLHRTSFRNEEGKVCCGLCVGGQQINALIRRLKKGLQSEESIWHQASYSSIVMMVGTNDLLRGKSVKHMQTEFKHLLKILKKTPIEKLLICTIPPCKNFTNVLEYNAFIREVCSKKGIKCLDVHQLVCDQPTEAFERDRIHLNRRCLRSIWRKIVEAMD